jgi:hypothetical protein
MRRGCLMFPDRLTLVLLLLTAAARFLAHPPGTEAFAFLYLIRLSVPGVKIGEQRPTR